MSGVIVQDWKDGEVKVRGAVITKTSTGKSQGFLGQIVSFSIYETVEREFLVADFIIYDGIGLMEDLPITGEETVTISFSTRTGNEFRQTFVVNEVLNVVPDSEQAGVSYILRCYSPHAMQNAAVRIYRTYNNQISEMVRDVMSTEIGFAGATDITPTVGPQKINCTGWRPYQFINFLKYRAVSSRTEGSLFVSYYDRTGTYRFKTVEEMIASPVGSKVFGRHVGATTNGFQSRESQILKIVIPQNQNTYKQIADGALGTNIYAFDLFTKRLTAVSSGPERQYLSTNPRANGGSQLNPTTKATIGVRAAANQLRRSIIPVNLAPLEQATYQAEALSRKAQYQATLNNLATVQVYGDPNIGVGSQVALVLQKPDLNFDQQPRGSLQRMTYLVMRAKHTVTRQDDYFVYKQTLDLLLQGYAS